MARRCVLRIALVLACILGPAQLVFAAVEGVFFLGDRQAMLNISPRAMDGVTDTDPMDVFNLMNVDPQDSFMGRGKFIGTILKDFNLSCADRGAQGYQCSLILRPSKYVVIDSQHKKMAYELKGEMANQFASLFQLDSKQALNFLSADHRMQIKIDRDSFVLIFAQGGLSTLQE